jgi:hypothetical protein
MIRVDYVIIINFGRDRRSGTLSMHKRPKRTRVKRKVGFSTGDKFKFALVT